MPSNPIPGIPWDSALFHTVPQPHNLWPTPPITWSVDAPRLPLPLSSAPATLPSSSSLAGSGVLVGRGSDEMVGP